ncbi:MAG: tRNA (N(6)-L-threonylcarbamoyladenosine(37)-C(2))-methylthiotransferase [Nanobdellota archaeon]
MKVFVKTFGCSLNKADSLQMTGYLERAGFTLVDSEDTAQVVVVNTCCVKDPTESKVVHYVENLSQEYVVVTGCIPQALPDRLSGYTMLGTTQQHHIVEAVEETVNGNTLVMLSPEEVSFDTARHGTEVEIIPISRGCLGSCTYCIVKRARGNLRSYPPDQIVKRVRQSVARQIWLTAQDTGCYGMDIGATLPALLDKVVRLPGDFMVRLGMLNPEYALQHFDGLMKAFESGKLYQFIHIPVQAGNDTVLSRMRRNYTRDLFIDLVGRIRKRFPGMTIATDIICGFPGETEQAFEETLDLIRKTAPEVVNISRYWPRKGTPALELDGQVDPEVARDRSRKVNSTVDWVSYEANKKWMKWRGAILIDEHGKDNTSVGRNYAYRPVIVPGRYALGTRLKVQVVQRTQHDLRATVISEIGAAVKAYK